MDGDAPPKTIVQQRLAQWRQDLLDFTNRNQLLNFRPSVTRPSSIRLVDPNPNAIYENLLQDKQLLIVGNDLIDEADEQDSQDLSFEGQESSQTLLAQAKSPKQDAGSTTENRQIRVGEVLSSMSLEKTNRVALRLLVRARSSEQEQGINVLFAAFGLLKWQENPGTEDWRTSPLVMLPLRIEENARESRFRIRSAGDDPEFNETLAERLRRDFGFDLGVEIDEETTLREVFDEVRATIDQRPGWEVLEQTHIGLFQFHKLRMFKDLDEHADIAAEHEIVQALALEGVTISPPPEDIPSEEELDRVVPPNQTFTVLDADSSQLRAIQAANRGAHLIIEGPPGTGKSQTIANMIAESIAAGKTILFVSEKAAAIEVVHSRLKNCGLAEFCLMLHSQKANKREVISELGNRLSGNVAPPYSREEELNLVRLRETREQLNAYVESLHRVREPFGQSVYWAIGQLTRISDARLLNVAPPAVEQLTYEQLIRWQQLIQEVGSYSTVLSEGRSHPWACIRLQDMSIMQQELLRQSLNSLEAEIEELQIRSASLAGSLNLHAPETLQEILRLAGIATCIPGTSVFNNSWFDPAQIQKTKWLAIEAKTRSDQANSLAESLLKTYDNKIVELSTPDIIGSYQRGSLLRLFSPGYRRSRAQVRALAKDGKRNPTRKNWRLCNPRENSLNT